MNLDEQYSEQTLKTNAKLVLVVLDGLGDIATKEQNYLTPLEAAHTPNLDAIARDSAQGLMIPGPLPGVMPGATGIMRPCAEFFAILSRFGVCAASSGVR